MRRPRTRAGRSLLVTVCFALICFAAGPSFAGTKIQHLVTPGGIEAWFVQDATVPLVAMEYAFSGGSAQDPPDKPGVGHYYRLQGPTFLVEFVNVQADSAGNPANHIHSVWRDMTGDFALALE